MKFSPTKIREVILIEPKVFQDARGYFYETYTQSVFEKNGIHVRFIQDNETLSAAGVIRGLHLQIEPRAQAKLIRVAEGEIYDVAVDVRKGSPNFGKYVGEVLSASNKKMLYVPPGFAHGYCALKNDTKVLYKVTDFYSPDHERGILWSDPALGIEWPKIGDGPIVSEKDQKLPTLKKFAGV